MDTIPLHSGPDPPAQSKVARAATALVAVLTLLAASPGVGNALVGLLALVPQATVGKVHLWNVWTATLLEPYPPSAVLTLPAFFALARWIEPVWGPRDLILFLLAISLSAGLSCFVLVMIAFYASSAQLLLFTPIGGLNAVVFGLLVSLRQLMPEHAIGPAVIGLRAKFIPILVLTALLLTTIAQITYMGTFLYAMSGLQAGWIYLRFFQRRDVGRGDFSESFSYDGFFPEPLATPVRLVGAFLFVVFRPLLMTMQGDQATEKSAPLASNPANSADAERHRQRALRALNERLGSGQDTQSDPQV